MKVIHCSNSISASSAVTKLHRALLRKDVDSRILTLYNKDDIEQTALLSVGPATRSFHHLCEAVANYWMSKRYKIEDGLPFCFGTVGYDITKNPWIKEADIIHLHWVSGNFLSVFDIYKLLQLNKPIVWTLHDSWTLTGGCHVRLGCEKYRFACGQCPLLQSQNIHDATYWILRCKRKLLIQDNLHLIAPSSWMLQNIQKSSLFAKTDSHCIPNALNLSRYKIYGKSRAAEYLQYEENGKIDVLFGAAAGTTTSYKGYTYLKDALRIIWDKYQEIASKIVLHIFGSDCYADEDIKMFPIKCWGTIRDERKLVFLYNLADVYVFPSIDDNLPGTVMESLACGTPVAAFDTGGVSDMVIHKKNGYIAQQKSTEQLAEGLVWILQNNTGNILGEAGRIYVKEHFDEAYVARQHQELYAGLLRKTSVQTK